MNAISRAAAVVAALVLAAPASASSAFFPVRLADDIVLQLPGDWTIVEGNPRNQPQASVESRAAPDGEVDAESQPRFSADDYDDAGRVAARVEVRYHPWQSASQDDAAGATEFELGRVDRAMHAAVEKSFGELGIALLEWKGTVKRDVNGTAAFLTEYRRSPYLDNGNFVVRILRVLDGPRSFSVTVSYREQDGAGLGPVCERILSSLRRGAPGQPRSAPMPLAR
ncbi:MAG TPA: hypothetical protein VLS49_03130 [Usitatibacter sp.]|nr:hypothetical protein [Usitatibacter sp.]